MERILKQLPKKVILMNLDNVGTCSGPDLDWLKSMVHINPDSQFFGAGGLRNAEDYENVTKLGARGWLVGTALFTLMMECSNE